MVSPGYSEPTYSYTVQWVPYFELNPEIEWSPENRPQYSEALGSMTPVTENVGTDHGADTCFETGGF